MGLTNKRKAELRWEVIDSAFNGIEIIDERDGLTDEEWAYMKQAIRRAARCLNVTNHVWL